jgi:hypothetical protein
MDELYNGSWRECVQCSFLHIASTWDGNPYTGKRVPVAPFTVASL